MSENERLALFHAEKIGVYEYLLNGDWMEYWSLFDDGFYFIRYNVQDGTELRDGFIPWTKQDGRPVPEFLITEHGHTKYNYFCG